MQVYALTQCEVGCIFISRPASGFVFFRRIFFGVIFTILLLLPIPIIPFTPQNIGNNLCEHHGTC